MPTITGNVVDRKIIIDVAIQPTSMTGASLQSYDRQAVFKVHKLRGLVDTGATCTCITKSAAQQIGLLSRGKRRVSNVTTDAYHREFSFWFSFWISDDDGQRPHQLSQPIHGIEFKDSPDFDVLIGMDVLTFGKLKVRFGKFYTLEFN